MASMGSSGYTLLFQISDALKNFDKINAFMSNQIDEHRATYDKNNPRDFIDLYLEKESERHGEAAVFSGMNVFILFFSFLLFFSVRYLLGTLKGDLVDIAKRLQMTSVD